MLLLRNSPGEFLFMKQFETDSLITPQRQATVRFATPADLPRIKHIARITWNTTYSEVIAPENRRVFLERAYKT
jgi:hypothetical protein